MIIIATTRLAINNQQERQTAITSSKLPSRLPPLDLPTLPEQKTRAMPTSSPSKAPIPCSYVAVNLRNLHESCTNRARILHGSCRLRHICHDQVVVPVRLKSVDEWILLFTLCTRTTITKRKWRHKQLMTEATTWLHEL